MSTTAERMTIDPNPEIVWDVKQGSPEWHALRCGKPTASRFEKITTSTGKASTQRKGLLYALIGEKLGESSEGVGNKSMERGLEYEANARDAYALEMGVDVDQCGFVWGTPDHTFGCSPDGLVGDDGLVQIKVPMLKTQAEYLDSGGIPTKYKVQVWGELFTTGRQWADFWSYSYHPWLKSHRHRVTVDDNDFKAWCDVFAEALAMFVSQLAELEKAILHKPAPLPREPEGMGWEDALQWYAKHPSDVEIPF